MRVGCWGWPQSDKLNRRQIIFVVIVTDRAVGGQQWGLSALGSERVGAY